MFKVVVSMLERAVLLITVAISCEDLKLTAETEILEVLTAAAAAVVVSITVA